MVYLRQGSYAIALPNPELNDDVAQNIRVRVGFNMLGATFAIKRAPSYFLLTMTFNRLARNRAMELLAFLEATRGEFIYLTLYDGDVYYGSVLSDPINLNTAGHGGGADTRKEGSTITLKFEGNKV